MMKPYDDIDGDSGVASYDNGAAWIDVRFKGSERIYRYSYNSAGKDHVATMQRLADLGNGLNAYINKFVQDKYER